MAFGSSQLSTKFKPSFMFFKLSLLTTNNVIWVNFPTIPFDETQDVVKTSTTGYVPVCYEVISLFIKPQNFLLMFFICKLKGFYLIVTTCDGLLMVFLHFDCKLLLNMRKQHIAAVSSEVFCLWLLTWKYYLIHPFLISESIVFLPILWPIHGLSFRSKPCQLPLMSVICITTKASYNISGLGGLTILKCLTNFPGTCPKFFIDGYNA